MSFYLEIFSINFFSSFNLSSLYLINSNCLLFNKILILDFVKLINYFIFAFDDSVKLTLNISLGLNKPSFDSINFFKISNLSSVSGLIYYGLFFVFSIISSIIATKL